MFKLASGRQGKLERIPPVSCTVPPNKRIGLVAYPTGGLQRSAQQVGDLGLSHGLPSWQGSERAGGLLLAFELQSALLLHLVLFPFCIPCKLTLLSQVPSKKLPLLDSSSINVLPPRLTIIFWLKILNTIIRRFIIAVFNKGLRPWTLSSS